MKKTMLRILCILAALVLLGGIALLTSLLPAKLQKWTAVAVGLFLAVLYLAEYFMIDAYKTFMSLSTMLSRAGDVAGDYGDTVASVLKQNVPRIVLVLLPVVPEAESWQGLPKSPFRRPAARVSVSQR